MTDYEDYDLSHFASKIAECRRQLGINQKTLAERMNISPARLNAWEKGKREPDVRYIRLLAHELGVSVDELLETQSATSTANTKTAMNDEALAVARDYDALDRRGKIIVRSVLDAEALYLQRASAGTQAFFTANELSKEKLD